MCLFVNSTSRHFQCQRTRERTRRAATNFDRCSSRRKASPAQPHPVRRLNRWFVSYRRPSRSPDDSPWRPLVSICVYDGCRRRSCLCDWHFVVRCGRAIGPAAVDAVPRSGRSRECDLHSLGLPSASVDSGSHSISGDGRYVVMESTARDLVTDDFNSMSDIFLRDRQTGTTAPEWNEPGRDDQYDVHDGGRELGIYPRVRREDRFSAASRSSAVHALR
jgi:hypothetical protein